MVALLVITGWNLISFIPEGILYIHIYKTIPKLALPKGNAPKLKANIFVTLYQGWKTYIYQSVCLASLSYVLLYITVLSPGVLLTTFLKSIGLEDLAIAGFRMVILKNSKSYENSLVLYQVLLQH